MIPLILIFIYVTIYLISFVGLGNINILFVLFYIIILYVIILILLNVDNSSVLNTLKENIIKLLRDNYIFLHSLYKSSNILLILLIASNNNFIIVSFELSLYDNLIINNFFNGCVIYIQKITSFCLKYIDNKFQCIILIFNMNIHSI